MLIHRNGFDNWTLTLSGSSTATVTDSYFEFSSPSSAIATLSRVVMVLPGQTLRLKFMASTSWQRPRVEFDNVADSALLNYVDMDLIVGTQACELQWTNPLTSAATQVKIVIGSVSGLAGAGIITEAEIHLDGQYGKRIIAEGVIKIENGVATIDDTYDVLNVAGVACDSATITVDLKNPLVQSAAGFVKPTVMVGRISGGALSPALLQFMQTYAANKISINSLSMTQNVTTKDISFNYFNWTAVTTAIRVNFIVYQ